MAPSLSYDLIKQCVVKELGVNNAYCLCVWKQAELCVSVSASGLYSAESTVPQLSIMIICNSTWSNVSQWNRVMIIR